jgi:hypothetical protein
MINLAVMVNTAPLESRLQRAATAVKRLLHRRVLGLNLKPPKKYLQWEVISDPSRNHVNSPLAASPPFFFRRRVSIYFFVRCSSNSFVPLGAAADRLSL